MMRDSSHPPHVTALADYDSEVSKVLQQVEYFLDGKIVDPSANAIAEQVLCDQALRHKLVFAGRQLAQHLRSEGLSVELNYCTSKNHGHPLPFLIVRRPDGTMVLPEPCPTDPHLNYSDVCVIDCNASADLRCRVVAKGNASRLPSNSDPLVPTKTGALVLLPFR